MAVDTENLQEPKNKWVALAYILIGATILIVTIAFWVQLGFDLDFLAPLIIGPVILLWGLANFVLILQKTQARKKWANRNKNQ